MLVWHQEFKDATADVLPCKRKWEIQDGGRQTRSKMDVLISQPPDQISTPFQLLTPKFSGCSNPMALLRIVPDVTGSRFFKMAAANPEVLISQLTDHIATPFQRLNPILGVQEVHGAISNTARCDFLDPQYSQ